MERWRSRLRAFYWAHDPRKVDRVVDILANHRGKEEAFLQRVHREFGVRDFSGEEAIDDIYEHQRYSYLSFSWGSSFPGHLLPTDRHQWSGLHGSPSSQTRTKVEPQLPVNWNWTSDWVVDKTSCKCDADGWVYALDFTMINYLVKKGEERSEPNATDYVRRRRWVRTRRRHFSMGLDKVAFDAAWKSAVQDLEQVYLWSKEQRAKTKQKWGVKKEKIKRQMHLLEKTIVSMQAVALEEEQKRQQERAHKATPTEASMDSPTNAVNLAARMHCAQSKLDALRRFYWHPREKGYSLRFSIDGIFYGLRDFFVESFAGSYSIQISHQTNGAQGITPTCKISMKGHTVCCGKHVKVVGEKGTRIPKSIWDSMYMDSDFEASINLIYVEDIEDQSAVGQGRWEFLFSPEATYVELINFTRRVKGGMDLPEPMVRKLCSNVLSSLIRDLTLLYFPSELALAFNLPPAKLDLKGEIKITGLSIDHVMEKELKEMDLHAIREEQAKQKLREQAGQANGGDGNTTRPSSPIKDAASAAALMFSSLLTGSNKEMQAIAEVLHLSLPQFNLLIALKNSSLFPATYSFRSLASMYNDGERETQDERLRATWKRVLELLFDIDKLFDTIKRLSKKPASVQVSVKHFYSTLNALNVVEALTKLYERIVLGIDYSKPRTGADGFIYGIRLGRKATVHPAMAKAAAAAAASAAVNSDGEMHPVGSPPVLDLRRYRPAEVSFRTRVQAFSNFWQTLKKVIEFVRENVDDVSAELAGSVRGTGEDCELNGSFKDADYRGPLSMGLAVPPCFLGFYRAEMVTLGNDRVGMQQTVKALEPVGRVMLADLSTEVLLDLDALIAREEERDDANVPLPSTPRALGQLNVSTSEFTKLHTTAKAGSFMLRLLSIADYLFTHYVQPHIMKAFPQHQVLFDTAKRNIMALLQSPKLELDFDIMARAFIHEDKSLMLTCCGSPLHPTPMTFKDEVNLLDIILQVDDLVNIWIDDRYPPYSNPLYF
ncbi:uncharacterized protein PITG_13273 [Phytophthora infestans T30-4]|uniref:Peroxin/Ferlin domain-containing protein n=1 Tax=Phytophthora infestans (strain T30-4) TaxID=403677 RepID=D0NLK7_PHYIT|nr:uncharacterized protein PITG_13273 [Phytophthora infestans T30-4]EEY60554.1 conserved hypothetical protein [Phytophthora infestans T30-4]|eukprot:XP_002899927.1 conserved hypothetical protein [Phytophthora infestans T30-4]